MSFFDTLVVQPIFNILMAIYALIPGNDFGLSLIIFAIVIRLALWPLIKKQLHQTKVMRVIQPELKKIKIKAKGNKQLEGQLMLELYRERGVNPFSSIGVLLLQLPIYIALFSVIRIITNERDRIEQFVYSFVQSLAPVREIINDPPSLNESLFGVVNLTKHAIGSEGIYVPLVILAIISAIFQYYQTKQISPVPSENKKLRDIFKASAGGEQVDQAEVSAIMSQKMLVFFPVIAFVVALYLPGALVLFYAMSSVVAVIQQRHILKDDVEEMETLADNSTKDKKVSDKTKTRVAQAQDAEIVPTTKKKSSKKRKRR